MASVGNWIFDLLEFGKYILSVGSSLGRIAPSDTHARTLVGKGWGVVGGWVVWYSSPFPKHIFVLDVFAESLHGDYRCSLPKLGICFKL